MTGSIHGQCYESTLATDEQEGLVVTSLARDDPSPLPRDDPFPRAH